MSKGVSSEINWEITTRSEKDAHQVGQGLTFHGGSIIADPRVFVIFLGVLEQDEDSKLLDWLGKVIGPSPFTNLLHQYGVNPGTVIGHTAFPFARGNALDKDIRKLIVAMKKSDALAKTANCFMVFMSPGVGVSGDGATLCEESGDNAFGYHDCFWHGFSRNYYAIIPALDDACITATCGQNNPACSLNIKNTRFERQCSVASHEFAEMVTDPDLYGWRVMDEIGDFCNGMLSTVTLNSEALPVQKQYSKWHDEQGQPACQAGADQPLPAYPLKGSFSASFDMVFTEGWHLVSNNVSMLT